MNVFSMQTFCPYYSMPAGSKCAAPVNLFPTFVRESEIRYTGECPRCKREIGIGFDSRAASLFSGTAEGFPAPVRSDLLPLYIRDGLLLAERFVKAMERATEIAEENARLLKKKL